MHVRVGRIFPNEQHGESELLNPYLFGWLITSLTKS
uniref:Uncharacterized protein n=1 Tax=Rhizophora mucronata TaxID=61149 RepID=A0A2P2NT98_RHIMU